MHHRTYQPTCPAANKLRRDAVQMQAARESCGIGKAIPASRISGGCNCILASKTNTVITLTTGGGPLVTESVDYETISYVSYRPNVGCRTSANAVCNRSKQRAPPLLLTQLTLPPRSANQVAAPMHSPKMSSENAREEMDSVGARPMW